MGDVVQAIVTVILGLAVFLAALLLLYHGTNLLPKRLREGSQVAVFLGPALVMLAVGLALPALQTVLASLTSDP